MTKHEFSSKIILTKEEAESYRVPWEQQLKDTVKENISIFKDNVNNKDDKNDNKIDDSGKNVITTRSLTCFCCVFTCCYERSTKVFVNEQVEDKQDENGNIKPTPGQVEHWSSDFKHVLSDENGRQLFTLFLRGEYSEENLEFWLEVEQFKKIENGELLNRANDIYLKFVKPMSEREVNISGINRRKIAEFIEKEEFSNDLFDSAQAQVHNLMHRQSYPRFLTSDLLKVSP